MKNPFYVYQLIDPRNALPFYVGKGQKLRAWQHERFVRACVPTSNVRKTARIREIVESGQSVQVRIVARYESELDALDHEFRLVAANPTLTNVAPGGQGHPAIIERRRRLREKMREAAIKRDRDRKLRKLMAIRGAERYEEEIAAFVIRLDLTDSLQKRQHQSPQQAKTRRSYKKTRRREYRLEAWKLGR